MNRFQDKVAFITGGGRGMGRAVALRLASEGAAVVVSARTASHGQRVVDEILGLGGRAALVTGDVGERQAVRSMVAGAIAAFGRLDVAVHCAADNSHGRIAEMDEAAFERLAHANLHALFWLSHDLHPWLAASKGRLVFISSAASTRSVIPGLVAYTASKAYMNTFARGLAMEWARDGVLVNVVEPGLIASDRMRTTLADDIVAKVASRFPVPRPGECEEIAAAVAFLASPEARYITGSSLLVDGGCSMTPLADVGEELH